MLNVEFWYFSFAECRLVVVLCNDNAGDAPFLGNITPANADVRKQFDKSLLSQSIFLPSLSWAIAKVIACGRLVICRQRMLACRARCLRVEWLPHG